MLTTETRDALLYGQLQEGLKIEIMQAPAVSRAQSYTELCVAARNEQHRQEELQKRQSYNERRTGRVTQPAQPSGAVPAQRNASQEGI